ncbi:TadE family protein [Achromobacter xylosoxidans]
MPQRGAAALEFTLVMAVLLSVAALVADAARWQVTRQVAHLALMEAARAGSTGHADPTRIRDAFLRALRPLHAGPQGETAGRRLARNQERIAARMGTVPWRIEILQPDIFRANILRLRLTYLYQPLLPPLRTLLAGLAENDGSYAAAARARAWRPSASNSKWKCTASRWTGLPVRRIRRAWCRGMPQLALPVNGQLLDAISAGRRSRRCRQWRP